MTESSSLSAAEQLSKGLLEIYEPHLKTAKAQLAELVAKQEQIQNDMQIVNDNFSEHKLQPTNDMIQTLRSYKDKLLKIRKQMLEIHQKTRSLKKRAIFIRDFKTKESEEKIRKRLQEEALIGKSVMPSGSSS